MNILIVKTSAIGDVTHTLPALNALRKFYPESRITWLVEKAASDVIEGHRALDRILISERKRWIKNLREPRRRFALAEIHAFIEHLRDTKYDLAIDFQGLLKSGIWMALARARRKVGFGPGMDHAEHSWIFYNERVPAVSMEHHAVKRELMLLSSIGISCRNIEFDYPVSEDDHHNLSEVLSGCGIGSDSRIVCINPMARWETKLWYPERFAQVADRLAKRNFAVIFTGGHEDFAPIRQITAQMKSRAINLAGKTSLKTFGALFQRSDLLVTTDTGPMHICAAVDTPVIAIFGPTAPWRTGPFGDRHRVIRSSIKCSPCFKRNCSARQCMNEISIGKVMETIGEMLQAV